MGSNAYAFAHATLDAHLAEVLIVGLGAFPLEDALRRKIEAKIQNLVPSGIYEHFKSTDESPKRYAVFGVAEGTEDLREWVVVYSALYPPHYGKLAWRPLIHPECGFLVPVERDEYKGPRFTLIQEMSGKDLWTLMRHAHEEDS
jgi:hypothetical protein